jgi:hypothetical protein
MARTIRLDQVGTYVEQQMEKLLRSAVLETDGLLKEASPVDLGRFRASWQVGENAAFQGMPPSDYRGPTSATTASHGIQPNRNVYSVHNNATYAENELPAARIRQRLFSPQQPAICGSR